MKWIKLIQITIVFFVVTTSSYAQYITVNDTYSAQQLVQDILVNSPCANVSNFSASGGNFSTGEKVLVILILEPVVFHWQTELF